MHFFIKFYSFFFTCFTSLIRVSYFCAFYFSDFSTYFYKCFSFHLLFILHYSVCVCVCAWRMKSYHHFDVVLFSFFIFLLLQMQLSASFCACKYVCADFVHSHCNNCQCSSSLTVHISVYFYYTYMLFVFVTALLWHFSKVFALLAYTLCRWPPPLYTCYVPRLIRCNIRAGSPPYKSHLQPWCFLASEILYVQRKIFIPPLSLSPLLSQLLSLSLPLTFSQFFFVQHVPFSIFFNITLTTRTHSYT